MIDLEDLESMVSLFKNRIKCLRTTKERPELYHRERKRLVKLIEDTQARIQRIDLEFNDADSLIEENLTRLQETTRTIKLERHAKKIEALRKATVKLGELSKSETV